MGDAIPLNIAPQTVAQTAASTVSTSIQIPVTLTALPDTLSDVARPLSLTGTIVDMLQDSSFVMKTSLGTVQLAVQDAQSDLLDILTRLLDTPTSTSGKLDLIIQPGSPPKTAALLVPNSQKAEEAQASGGRAITTSLTAATPQSTSGSVPSLKVMVLPDDPPTVHHLMQPLPNKELTEAQQDLPRFLQRVVGTTPKARGEASIDTKQPTTMTQGDARSSGTLATATPTTPSATATVATPSGQSGTSAMPLQTGQSYELKVMQKLAPDASWPERASLPENTVQATVVGKSLTSHILLQAGDKTLFVQDKLDLPVGTKVLAQMQPLVKDSLTLLPQGSDKDFLPLREVIEMLQSLSPQGAQAVLDTHVPTPAHHFAGTTLFLLSALQNGKLDEWLGPAARYVLESNNKRHLKQKLADALSETLNASPHDKTVGEWKAYPIPLHYEGAYELLQLYVHQDHADHRQGNQSTQQVSKTRFVITMNMSRLGSIQLDGLSQKKQLDLVIRSEHPLPDGLIASLRETTIKSLEAVGLVGTLNIQSGRQNWISFEDSKVKSADVVT